MPRARSASGSLRLQHLRPDVLHLLVEVGVGRRIGLRARQEARLLVEAQRLLLLVGQRRLLLAGIPQ